MITLHWDTLGTGENKQVREEICTGACVNERMAHYDWDELDIWLRDILNDSLKLRSKGAVQLVQ